jgi:hypothetical protein
MASISPEPIDADGSIPRSSRRNAGSPDFNIADLASQAFPNSQNPSSEPSNAPENLLDFATSNSIESEPPYSSSGGANSTRSSSGERRNAAESPLDFATSNSNSSSGRANSTRSNRVSRRETDTFDPSYEYEVGILQHVEEHRELLEKLMTRAVSQEPIDEHTQVDEEIGEG